MDRLARHGHLAVGRDPAGFDVRHDFRHKLIDDILPLQAGQLLECRVDVEKPVIAGLALFVADDLVQGEPFRHMLEEGAVPLLALAQGRFRLLEIFEHQGVGLGRGPSR